MKLKLLSEVAHTVDFPNSVEKILPFFVSTALQLFYIKSKMLPYVDILWILLFEMVYYLSDISHIFLVISSIYEK